MTGKTCKSTCYSNTQPKHADESSETCNSQTPDLTAVCSVEKARGCCSPKVEQKATEAQTGGGCCSGGAGDRSPISEANTTEETDYCKPAPASIASTDCGGGSCCEAPKPVTKCAGASGPSSDKPDPCCEGEEAKDTASADTPVCCQGKPSPCCNDDCIDRIALRECGKALNDPTGHCAAGDNPGWCETKLVRALESLQGVKNLKASLVMSRAELDYDSRIISAAEVIRQLERKTGFECEEISTKGASIDVLPNGDVQAFAQQTLPLGVTSTTIIGKDTVKIHFDPKVVGARDLVEKAFGTRLDLAPIRQDSTLDAGNKHVRHMGYMTILSAVLTIPVLVLAWAPLADRPVTYGAVSLALATIVQVAIAGPFYPAALKSLFFSRLIEMDLLIVLSTSAAYVFSVISFGYLAAGIPLATGQFFETSTLLVTLIMVGRYETQATLVSTDGGVPERDVDSRLLQYGDVFKLTPDCRAPTDGIVVSGSSEIDESMLTGEPRPVEKHPGSMIAAGSINGHGNLTVRLTRLPDENTISMIAGMVDDAKLTKPHLQSMANYVASLFVPLVVGLTVLVFVVWIGVGIRQQERTGTEAAIQATTYAITVLVVSCPCAIGLAVPVVIVIASGMAARRGVIFKSATGIETVHKATHIVFDKTGTLTEGVLSVVAEEYLEGADSASTAAAILGLVDGIKHPVSAAMASHLKIRGVKPVVVRDVKSLTGKGVEGTMGESQVRAGNSRWLGLESDERVQKISALGLTTLCVTLDSYLVAVFGLSDAVRTEAVSVITELKKRGIELSILSGDEAQAVARVAEAVGIPASMVKAHCSPADKAKYIKDLISASPVATSGNGRRGKKEPANNNVIFVGDGTNDAPALAQATTGVHLPPPNPSGSTASVADVASSAADVVLLRSSLEGLVDMLDLSRAAVRRIWFNFGWSFVYNVFAILLAAGAFVSANGGGGPRGEVRIPPEYAGLGELVSVLPVILVAVSLRWARF
ncbi:hypothetical protein PG995_002496 [Apiospora arundinis]